MERYNDTTPIVVNGVPRKEYEEDVKAANKTGFITGVITGLALFIIAGGATYFISGFGEQKKYEIIEPNYNLPELREDVIRENGNLETGDTEVETIDE